MASTEPSVGYPRLLARVGEVTAAAREQTLLRGDLEQAGVRIYEQPGPARFADARTIESGVGEYQGLAALPGRGFAGIFTLAAPQAKNGPTDIFFARIGPG